MITRRRALSAFVLVLGATIASSLIVSSPADAANHAVVLDEGRVTAVEAEFGGFDGHGFSVSNATTSLRIKLPPEALELDLSKLGYTITGPTSGGYSGINNAVEENVLYLDPGLWANLGGTSFVLTVFTHGGPPDAINGLPTVDLDEPTHVVLTVKLQLGSVGGTEVYLPLTSQWASPLTVGSTASPFRVTREYTSDPLATIPVQWGDTVAIASPNEFWTTGPNGWGVTGLTSSVQSAGKTNTTSTNRTVSESGESVTTQLPANKPANVDWSTGTNLVLQFSERSPDGGRLERITRAVIPLNFFPTTRIAGVDRYATAALVAQQFTSADYIYVANGLNFPDALGAAPAAAFRDAPLLTTAPNQIQAYTTDEIVRLKPNRIIVVGGTDSISTEVEGWLNGMNPDDEPVLRIAGVDRYDTSRKIVDDIYGDGVTAGDAFFATGVNFPDALASSAAAAHFGAPVILVPGAATSVDDLTLDLATEVVGATKAYIAGGEGTVSAGIEVSLIDRFGAGNVDRRAGIDRYSTSVAINELFDTSDTVYLATGVGYADALAGAALAGVKDAPLFTVPSTCVPQAVLDAIDDLGATNIVLLGGIGTLSPAVGELTPCS